MSACARVIAAPLVAACSGSGGSTTPAIALIVPPAPSPIQTNGTIVFGTSMDMKRHDGSKAGDHLQNGGLGRLGGRAL